MNPNETNACPPGGALDFKAARQVTMAFVLRASPCGLQAIADHIQERFQVQPRTARGATVDAVQTLLQNGSLTQDINAYFIPVRGHAVGYPPGYPG